MMVPKFRVWDETQHKMLQVGCIEFIDGKAYWVGNVRGGNDGPVGDNSQLKLEQYTGLKDVNGKDIYEGDIVTVQATNDDGSTDGMLGKIVYDEDIASFEFTTTGKDGWYTSSFDNLFEEGFFDIHVIGNVHENPELLEARHD